MKLKRPKLRAMMILSIKSHYKKKSPSKFMMLKVNKVNALLLLQKVVREKCQKLK